MPRMNLDDCKEADMICQIEGHVVVSCLPDDHIAVPPGDLMTLLGIVLTAIRVHGDEDAKALAAKVCRSMLGGR